MWWHTSRRHRLNSARATAILLVGIFGISLLSLLQGCGAQAPKETFQASLETPSGVSPVLGWTLFENGSVSLSLTLSGLELSRLGWYGFGVSSSDGLGSSIMYGGPKGGAAIIARRDRLTDQVMEYSLLGPRGHDIVPWKTRGPTAADVKTCLSEFCLEKAQTCLANPRCAGTLRCGLQVANMSTSNLEANLTLMSDASSIESFVKCTSPRLPDPTDAEQSVAAGALLRLAGCALEACTSRILDSMPILNMMSYSVSEVNGTLNLQVLLSSRRIADIEFGTPGDPVVFMVAFGEIASERLMYHTPRQRTFLALNLDTGQPTKLGLPVHVIIHVALASVGFGFFLPVGLWLNQFTSTNPQLLLPIVLICLVGLVAGVVAGIVAASGDPYQDLTRPHAVVGFSTVALVGVALLGKVFFSNYSRTAKPEVDAKKLTTTTTRERAWRVGNFLAGVVELVALGCIIANTLIGYTAATDSAVDIPLAILTAPVLATLFCGIAMVSAVSTWIGCLRAKQAGDAVSSSQKDLMMSGDSIASDSPLVSSSPQSPSDPEAIELTVPETVVPFILSWKDVTVFPSKNFAFKSQTDVKPIVQSAIGVCSPRTLTAIMGPSGSGKTSLLDIISLRRKIGPDDSSRKRGSQGTKGRVTVNGRDATHFPRIHHLMAVVPQQDHLHEYLTVEETLEFMSAMVLPERASECDRRARVQEIVDQLDLGHILHSRVGGDVMRGVSGGERKRLSIALQLFKPVSCLILDEPTTGLDSEMALRLVEMLRGLANEGRTIIATIHQPSEPCFQLFDRLILLSGGYTILSGPRTDMLRFLREIDRGVPSGWNPAEWFLQLVDFEKDDEAAKGVEARITIVIDGSRMSLGLEDVKKSIRSYYDQVKPERLIDDPNVVDTLVDYVKKNGLEALDDQLRTTYNRSIKPFLLRSVPQNQQQTTTTTTGADAMLVHHSPTWGEVSDLLSAFAQSTYSAQLVKDIDSAQSDASARLALMDDRTKAEFFLYPQQPQSLHGGKEPLSPKVAEDHSPHDLAQALEKKSSLTQMRLLLLRSIKLIWRNPQALRIQVLQTVVLGVLLGALYAEVQFLETGQFQLTLSMAMIVGMVALVTVSSGTQVAFDDRLVFQREMRDAIYGPTVFFLQRMMTSIPIAIVVSLGIIVPAYFWVGLRQDRAAFAFFIMVNVLTLFTFDAIVYAIALLAKDIHTAYAIANFSEAVAMFFSGVSIPAYAMPIYLRWIHYISPFSYSFGAVVVNQFENSDDDFYINITGVVIQDKWINLLILLGFGIAFRVVGWLATIRLFRQNRPGGTTMTATTIKRVSSS